MRNIKLTLQYDGTDYFGWQRQKNTRRTVQEVIETILQKILKEKVNLMCAGRTDAGVHAQMQVANFTTASSIPPDKLRLALNAQLPQDIRVSAVDEVPLSFHSTYHPKRKTYRYTIINRPVHDVFTHRYAYWYAIAQLDVAKMRKASRILVGRHDFTSFRTTQKKSKKTSVREVENIIVSKKGDCICIDVTGRGFLYNMVRNIVGTLIDVGRGRIKPQDLKHILAEKKRSLAGPTAPAHGLSLLKVAY